MKIDSGMDLRFLHFMDHAFDGVDIQFINKYRVIVMNKRLDGFINIVAKKKRLVIKINDDYHDLSLFIPPSSMKIQ
jgi:hypothetical protein